MSMDKAREALCLTLGACLLLVLALAIVTICLELVDSGLKSRAKPACMKKGYEYVDVGLFQKPLCWRREGGKIVAEEL